MNTLENAIAKRETLLDQYKEYLSMIDTGCSTYDDMYIMNDIQDEIFSINARLKYEIEYFTEKQCGGYIAGYRRYNGYRIVNYYIRTRYNNKSLITLDHAHAKIYAAKQSANMAIDKLYHEHKISGGIM